MPKMVGTGLSRREREILEILHRLGEGTVTEVYEAMPEAPSYSAVRSILRIMEEKHLINHREDGKRYVFLPAVGRNEAAKSAIQNVMNTFFNGSFEGVVRTFLSSEETNLSKDELNQLSTLIEEAKKREL
jgi:BlaI family transcriptional regulator, penicillinase repressor